MTLDDIKKIFIFVIYKNVAKYLKNKLLDVWNLVENILGKKLRI